VVKSITKNHFLCHHFNADFNLLAKQQQQQQQQQKKQKTKKGKVNSSLRKKGVQRRDIVIGKLVTIE